MPSNTWSLPLPSARRTFKVLRYLGFRFQTYQSSSWISGCLFENWIRNTNSEFVCKAAFSDLGPCCGDGSGSADHGEDLLKHLKS